MGLNGVGTLRHTIRRRRRPGGCRPGQTPPPARHPAPREFGPTIGSQAPISIQQASNKHGTLAEYSTRGGWGACGVDRGRTKVEAEKRRSFLLFFARPYSIRPVLALGVAHCRRVQHLKSPRRGMDGWMDGSDACMDRITSTSLSRTMGPPLHTWIPPPRATGPKIAAIPLLGKD